MNMSRFFQGRLNRKNWALSVLVLYATSPLIDLIWPALGKAPAVILLMIVYLIGWVFLFSSFSCRRLHDLGMGGGYVLFLVLPIINILLFFYMLLKEGEDRDNHYGQKPTPGFDFPRSLFFAR